MDRNFLVSVVIPVYNAQEYLRETLRSIEEQTLGFHNIQLIIVDDGSTDGSWAIIEECKRQFPSNVEAILQANGGVSKARNRGLKEAKGRYLAFIDSDDQWSNDFLEKSIEFLKMHEEVDFVASKIKFFDGDIGSHPSNYKFSATRVIDVCKEPDNPIMHLATCVLRRDATIGLKFDETLKITEDTKYLMEVLLKKKAYGVLSEPTFYYRKRRDGSSATGGQRTTKDYYLSTPRSAYWYLMDLWRGVDGKIEKFMQNLILSDLFWRIQQPTQSVLTSSEENRYKQMIAMIVEQIDDDTIMSKRGLSVEQRMFFLKLKYGEAAYKSLVVRNGVFYWGEYKLCRTDDISVTVEFIEQHSDRSYKIEGYVSVGIARFLEHIELVTRTGTFTLKATKRVHRERHFLGDLISTGGAFEAIVESFEKKDEIEFCARDTNQSLKIHTEKFSGMSRLSLSYAKKSGIVMRKFPRHITIRSTSGVRLVYYEMAYLARLLLNWRLNEGVIFAGRLLKKNLKFLSRKAALFEVLKPFLVVVEAFVMIPRAIFLRIAHHLCLAFKTKPIWLVSDRGMAAGDNGEAFFRYIQSREDVDANVYFVVSKKSSDWQTMSAIGKVLNQGSLRHKLMFLLADKVISSHADIEVTNPFLRQIDHFVDLYTFDFVFLQHGITKDDISSWLNKYEKNISLFVTAGKPEYDSILEYPYYYDEKKVLLSGFPRYDYLSNRPKGKIIIAPTYRANLLRLNTDARGVRGYDASFKQSHYFKFYNNLLQDERLLEALKKAHMTAEFYLHPNFAAQIEDFQGTEVVSIASYPYDYKKAFSEGSLLVSDYSSTPFDFAYLKKPVIYTQFDEEQFFASHSYSKGYFNYQNDGFGPVYRDYEATVEGIIEMLEGGVVLSRKYSARIDKFFAYTDRNNSKRVYNALIK